MRNPPVVSLDYCPEPQEVPPRYECMWPDIFCEFDKLCQRYDTLVTKRKRIHQLAEPKWQSIKYEAGCYLPEKAFRKTNIVYADMPMNTRTEQLSYPQVRTMIELRKNPIFKNFTDTRKSQVNRLLRKSLLSVYSRLTNAQPPEKIEPLKKWTPKERAKHRRYFKRLSKPKVYMEPPAPARTGPDKPLHRYKRLARPKKYPDMSPNEWKLTPAAARYVPSQRVRQMAVPKIFEKFDPEAAYKVNPNAMHYKATKRIKELAVPSKMITNKPEIRLDPYKVAPNALRYKISSRIKELAEPKDYSDIHTRNEPYKVSPRALKAKATPRLIELAIPSHPVTPKVNKS